MRSAVCDNKLLPMTVTHVDSKETGAALSEEVTL